MATTTRNISNTISLGDIMTAKLMTRWNNVINKLVELHLEREVEINPALASKYRFDMHGLFSNELGIPKEIIYPQIRANGYNSSAEYDGTKTIIRILKSDILLAYYKLYTKK